MRALIFAPLLTVIAGCSASGATASEAVETATPVLEAPELMLHVIEPAAKNFWKGWGEVLDKDGWRDIAAKTEAEWKTVEDGAATALIAGTLLLDPSYAREPGERWKQLTQEFIDIARKGKASAEQQDKDAMFVLGERLDLACDACHAEFAPHVP